MIDRAALRSLLVEAAAEGAKIALADRAAVAKPQAGLDPMLSVSEAGDVLHVSVRTIRAWCASGRLRSRLVGRRRLISEGDIRALLDRDRDEEAAIERQAREMIDRERRSGAARR